MNLEEIDRYRVDVGHYMLDKIDPNCKLRTIRDAADDVLWDILTASIGISGKVRLGYADILISLKTIR